MQSAEGILIRKIFCWSIDPKNHEFVGTSSPTDFKIPRFFVYMFEQSCSDRSTAEAVDPFE
jgi:hypothetical protein